MEPILEWEAPEHHHVEKNNDWYWAVGIITLTAAVLAFILGNPIFGVLIIVGIFTLIVHASKIPARVHVIINDRGVVINSVLYPFLSLESFWIDAHEEPPKILFKSTKTFMPYIVIHIEGIDREEVRKVLLNYIAETEHHEPLSKKILERFGF